TEGTLTYFFNRPNSFSYRDIMLFIGFCQRATDALSLAKQSERLHERTRMLEIQAPVFTQVEIAHLLIHDLSHKLAHVEFAAQDIKDYLLKLLRKQKAESDTGALKLIATFDDAIKSAALEVRELKAVGRLPGSDVSVLEQTEFRLEAVVSDVINL